MNSLPTTQNAVRQSASPSTWKMRFAIGMNTAASGRGGRMTRHRWNIVDQSSSVRVTPLVLVSFRFGSGFFATGRAYAVTAGGFFIRGFAHVGDGGVLEQRHEGSGLPRRPRVGLGPWRGRAPGVVGDQ